MENEKSTEDRILDFYIELVEKSKFLFKYYLSEDIVLDWFGQTVKGQKNVCTFVRTNINPIRHNFREAKPTSDIGYRRTHNIIKTPKPSRRILRSTFLSPPRPSLMTTPVKQPLASTSARRQIYSRPNLNNNSYDRPSPSPANKSPPSPTKNALLSPRKRQKITPSRLDTSDIDILECENDISDTRVKYLTAEGNVEFHRPSLKKLQRETKWQRPCKIHIAYDSGKDIKDSSFYLIIYEGNVKCRRNLIRDFESEEPEN